VPGRVITKNDSIKIAMAIDKNQWQDKGGGRSKFQS